MMSLFFLILFIFAEEYYEDDERPPGFYRISFDDDERMKYTRLSTSTFKKKILHNGQPITAWDFRNVDSGAKELKTIKNQSSCGSCWAVAGTDVASSAMYLNSFDSSEPVNILMAPQYLLDCGNSPVPGFYGGANYTQGGCGGGNVRHSWRHFIMYGMVAETCMPYEKVQRTCSNTCTNLSETYKRYYDKTFEIIEATNVTDLELLRQMVVTSGPVAFSMKNYADLGSYKSGVYEHNKNLTDPVNHVMAVYGFGVEGGKNYWLVKNSWGSKFGDSGYIKIRMGTNECGMETRFLAINNYLNTSQPRRGVILPSPQPTPGLGWDCSTSEPNCTHTTSDYTTSNSSVLPPPPPVPADKNFSTPGNSADGVSYYVSTTGTGDCLSSATTCMITSALNQTAPSKILHLTSGSFLPIGKVFLDSEKNYSFIGVGMGETYLNFTHTTGLTVTASAIATVTSFSYVLMYSWRIIANNTSLYFTNMTLLSVANSTATEKIKYLTMFVLNNADAALTCASVNIDFDSDVNGNIVVIMKGKATFADCTIANTVCNSSEAGLIFIRNVEGAPSSLFMQNFTVVNHTTGAPIIWEHLTTSQPSTVFMSKCTFQNITTTNDAELAGVNASDSSVYRKSAVVFCAQNKHDNRRLAIHYTRFINISGIGGGFGAGALFLNSKTDQIRRIYNPNVTDCLFNNCVGRCGGAVFVMDGFLFFLRCQFRNNTYSSSGVIWAANDIVFKNNISDSIAGFYSYAESCSNSLQPRIRDDRRGDFSLFLPICTLPTACSSLTKEFECNTAFLSNSSTCNWVNNRAQTDGTCILASSVTCTTLLSHAQCNAFQLQTGTECCWVNDTATCMAASSSQCVVPTKCSELTTEAKCNVSTLQGGCFWFLNFAETSGACKTKGEVNNCSLLVARTQCNNYDDGTTCCFQKDNGGDNSTGICRNSTVSGAATTCVQPPNSCSGVIAKADCTRVTVPNNTLTDCLWVVTSNGSSGSCRQKANVTCPTFVNTTQCNNYTETGGCCWQKENGATASPGSCRNGTGCVAPPTACANVTSNAAGCTQVTVPNGTLTDCSWILAFNGSSGTCKTKSTVVCSTLLNNSQCNSYNETGGCCWQRNNGATNSTGACKNGSACTIPPSACSDVVSKAACTNVTIPDGNVTSCLWVLITNGSNGTCRLKSSVGCPTMLNSTQCNNYNETGGCCWQKVNGATASPASCKNGTDCVVPPTACANVTTAANCTQVTVPNGTQQECMWVLTSDESLGSCKTKSAVICSNLLSSTQCSSYTETGGCCWQKANGATNSTGTCKNGSACTIPPSACSDVTTKTACTNVTIPIGAVTSCIWVLVTNGSSGSCSLKSSVNCSTFVNTTQCNNFAEETGCCWQKDNGATTSPGICKTGNTTCVAPPTTCTQVTTLGECTSVTRLNGSLQECIWVLSSDGSSGSCLVETTSICLNLTNQGQCVNYTDGSGGGCCWQKLNGATASPGSCKTGRTVCTTPPSACGNVTVRNTCTSVTMLNGTQQECIWVLISDGSSGSCAAKSSITCNVLVNKSQCSSYIEGSGCCWQKDNGATNSSGTCKNGSSVCIIPPTACANVTTRTACTQVTVPNATLIECSWVADFSNNSGSCKTKTTVGCSTLLNAAQCGNYTDAGGCCWQKTNGMTNGPGTCRNGSACTIPPSACSQVTTKAACTSVTIPSGALTECMWILSSNGSSGSCAINDDFTQSLVPCLSLVNITQCEEYPYGVGCCWQRISGATNSTGSCRTGSESCTTPPSACEELVTIENCTSVTVPNGTLTLCFFVLASDGSYGSCKTQSSITCVAFVNRLQCGNYTTGSGCCWQAENGATNSPGLCKTGSSTCTTPPSSCGDVTDWEACTSVTLPNGTAAACMWALSANESSGSCVMLSSVTCPTLLNQAQCTGYDDRKKCCWQKENGGNSSPGTCRTGNTTCTIPPSACSDVKTQGGCTSVTMPNNSVIDCFWVLISNGTSGSCRPKSDITCSVILNQTQCINYTTVEGGGCCWQKDNGGARSGGRCQIAHSCITPPSSCNNVHTESDCTVVVAANDSTVECLWVRMDGDEGGVCRRLSALNCSSFLSSTQCTDSSSRSGTGGRECCWQWVEDGGSVWGFCKNGSNGCEIQDVCNGYVGQADCASGVAAKGEYGCKWISNRKQTGGACIDSTNVICEILQVRDQCLTATATIDLSATTTECCWESSIRGGGESGGGGGADDDENSGRCRTSPLCVVFPENCEQINTNRGTTETDEEVAYACNSAVLADGTKNACIWIYNNETLNSGTCSSTDGLICPSFRSPTQCMTFTGDLCCWRTHGGDGNSIPDCTPVINCPDVSVPETCSSVRRPDACTSKITLLNESETDCVWLYTYNGMSGFCEAASAVSCESFNNDIQCSSNSTCCWESSGGGTSGTCRASGLCKPEPHSCKEVTEEQSCSSVVLPHTGTISECLWIFNSNDVSAGGRCEAKATISCGLFSSSSQCTKYVENGGCCWKVDDKAPNGGLCLTHGTCLCRSARTSEDCTIVGGERCYWIKDEKGEDGPKAFCHAASNISCSIILQPAQCNTLDDHVFTAEPCLYSDSADWCLPLSSVQCRALTDHPDKCALTPACRMEQQLQQEDDGDGGGEGVKEVCTGLSCADFGNETNCATLSAAAGLSCCFDWATALCRSTPHSLCKGKECLHFTGTSENQCTRGIGGEVCRWSGEDFSCLAESLFDNGDNNNENSNEGKKKDGISTTVLIIIASSMVVIALVVASVIAIVFIVKRRRSRKNGNDADFVPKKMEGMASNSDKTTRPKQLYMSSEYMSENNQYSSESTFQSSPPPLQMHPPMPNHPPPFSASPPVSSSHPPVVPTRPPAAHPSLLSPSEKVLPMWLEGSRPQQPLHPGQTSNHPFTALHPTQANASSQNSNSSSSSSSSRSTPSWTNALMKPSSQQLPGTSTKVTLRYVDRKKN